MDHGVDYLIERVMAEPGELTLVCLAPLTNIALAVQRQPALVRAVREVVVMGGAVRPPGNATPVAEFNVYADPRAAAVVFGQPWRVTMVGLDVTSRVRLTRADRDALEAGSSAEAALVREVTRRHFDEDGGLDSIVLHDPLAVAVALEPDLVTTIETSVDGETRGEHTLGQTVVELRPGRARGATRVCLEVDVARARALFFEALRLSLR
jgi:purine nucleosidase